jgi:hypothetical protein
MRAPDTEQSAEDRGNDPGKHRKGTEMKDCKQCRGVGQVEHMEVRQPGRFQMQWVTCPACGGSGKEIVWTEFDLAWAIEAGADHETVAAIRVYLGEGQVAA